MQTLVLLRSKQNIIGDHFGRPTRKAGYIYGNIYGGARFVLYHILGHFFANRLQSSFFSSIDIVPRSLVVKTELRELLSEISFESNSSSIRTYFLILISYGFDPSIGGVVGWWWCRDMLQQNFSRSAASSVFLVQPKGVNKDLQRTPHIDAVRSWFISLCGTCPKWSMGNGLDTSY